MKIDYKSECDQQIAAIDRNKEFWKRHIPFLKEQGVMPSLEQVEWVDKHIQGLDALRTRLESFLKDFLEMQNNVTRPQR